MSAVLALDLGGTRLRAGLAGSAAPASVTAVGEWEAPRSRDEFSAIVGKLVTERGVERLGLSIPGLARGTTCAWVPNLPWLDGMDVGALFPGLVVGLGHDAQLALLAEAEAGCAQGATDVILLAIGTGIGSAVLAGGRIVRGATGAACSFGWASADVSDPGDDRLGWLERRASGRALDAAARTLGLADGKALIDAAAAGRTDAIEALSRPMTAIGTALAGAVALLDPQMIILSGGVAAAADVVAGPILTAARRHLPPHLRGIGIRAGAFGPKASLVGAAFAGHYGPGWGDRHG